MINNPAAEDPSIPVTTIKRNIVVINKSITSDQLKASQKSTTGLLNIIQFYLEDQLQLFFVLT